MNETDKYVSVLKMIVMDKIEVRETPNKGKGIYASVALRKGELIFDWDGGPVYEAERASDLPKNIRDYAIQFAPNKWIDTQGLGRYTNHSCNPNSGIQGLFKLVALRDISAGEEIVWDYDTTENSDWVMEGCRCGSSECREVIRGYRFLPEEIKRKISPYTSEWLKTKSS